MPTADMTTALRVPRFAFKALRDVRCLFSKFADNVRLVVIGTGPRIYYQKGIVGLSKRSKTLVSAVEEVPASLQASNGAS